LTTSATIYTNGFPSPCNRINMPSASTTPTLTSSSTRRRS
jgi:hypothetical protein